MGGRLALARADVTDPAGGLTANATVQVIGDLLRVSQGRTVVAELRGVDRLDRGSRQTWLVLMADGTRWTVVRKGGGCGCGR